MSGQTKGPPVVANTKTLARLMDQIVDRVERHLPQSSNLRRPLRRIRTRFPSEKYQDPVNRALLLFARSHPDATFFQVGAHDGHEQDPLWRHIQSRRWSGVMIEPVPYVFARLEALYGGDPRIALENVAIAPTEGKATLYHIPESAEKDLPPWYDALASFREDVLLKHERFIPDIRERVTPIEVECVTFESLRRAHGLAHIDIVQIDTEGYDYEIIKLIDLEKDPPTVLMYEHIHLDEQTLTDCQRHLSKHGYESYSDVMNTMSLHVRSLGSRDRRLMRYWRLIRSAGASDRVGVGEGREVSS